MRNRALGLVDPVRALAASSRPAAGPAPTSRRSASSPTSGRSRTSRSTRRHGSAPRPAPRRLGGTASNIVTKAPADYAANIKTFVDQGYGDHRHRRLRHGRRDDDRRQAVPEGQVHRRRPGRLHRRDRQERPDLRLQGRSEDAPAELPGPGLQGGAGRLPRRRPRRQRLQVGRHRHGRRDQHDPGGRPLHQRLPQRRRVGRDQARERQGGVRLDGHHQGVQRPGHRQVDRPADDRPEGGRHLPGRRPVRRRRDRGGVCHPGRHRHRRRRRPVEVAAAVGEVHPDQRREEARRRRLGGDRQGRGQDRRGRHGRVGRLDRPRSAWACRRSAATTRTS